MKTILFILSFGLLLTQGISGQKITSKDVPTAVMDSFKYSYLNHNKGIPFFSKTKWYSSNKNEYYATTRYHGQLAFFVFTANGHCMQSIIMVSKRTIPYNVHESLSALYPKYSISKAEDVYSDSGVRYYRLNISDGVDEKMVVMYYNCGLPVEEPEVQQDFTGLDRF